MSYESEQIRFLLPEHFPTLVIGDLVLVTQILQGVPGAVEEFARKSILRMAGMISWKRFCCLNAREKRRLYLRYWNLFASIYNATKRTIIKNVVP